MRSKLLGEDLCASVCDSPPLRHGGGAAAKAEDSNACCASSFRPESESESCSYSSSIGKNSDLDQVGDGEDEVQSSYKATLDSVNDLEEALPIRRGISKFYNGKSKSFASLAEASSTPSIEEIVKPENAYTRKRKNELAFSCVWGRNAGICKRPIRQSRSTVALAVAMGSSDSISSDTSAESNWSSSGAVSPTAALPPLLPAAGDAPWRSFSVVDLRQCSCDHQHV